MVLVAELSRGVDEMVAMNSQGSSSAPPLAPRRRHFRAEGAAASAGQGGQPLPPRAEPWAPRPKLWRQGKPSKMTNSQMAAALCPAVERLSPRLVHRAHLRWREAQMHDWVTVKCPGFKARPKKNIPPERLNALQKAFELMDSDDSGQIDFAELKMSMQALGFRNEEIRNTIKVGDVDGNGMLDFNEFVQLVEAATSTKRRGSSAHAAAAGSAGDSFPFALVADAVRINRLVDKYAPEVRESQPPFPPDPDARLPYRPATPTSAAPNRPSTSGGLSGRTPRAPPQCEQPQSSHQLWLRRAASSRRAATSHGSRLPPMRPPSRDQSPGADEPPRDPRAIPSLDLLDRVKTAPPSPRQRIAPWTAR